MRLTGRIALLCAPLVGLAASPANWAPSIATSATWNDNASNASRSSDAIGALRLGAETGTSRRFTVSDDDTVFLGAGLAVEAWPRFDGLDQAALGPRLAWRHKFGLGALAPSLGVELGGDFVAARDSARGGQTGTVTVRWGQRFDSATRLSITETGSRHDARDTVFATTAAQTAFEIVRDLDERWSLALAGRWRTGDLQSYATPPRPDIVALARVREPSTTFGRPFIVYSLGARSLGGSLAFTRSLDQTTACTLGCEWRQTERGSLYYVNQLVSASVAHQF